MAKNVRSVSESSINASTQSGSTQYVPELEREEEGRELEGTKGNEEKVGVVGRVFILVSRIVFATKMLHVRSRKGNANFEVDFDGLLLSQPKKGVEFSIRLSEWGRKYGGSEHLIKGG